MDYSTKAGWCDMWHLSGNACNLAWQAKQDMHSKTQPSHVVINDIQPYKSMVDGTMITSRSQHKAHLKQHGMIEIGNEKIKEHKPPAYNAEEVKRDLARQLYR